MMERLASGEEIGFFGSDAQRVPWLFLPDIRIPWPLLVRVLFGVYGEGWPWTP
jgi:hypothetical protein